LNELREELKTATKEGRKKLWVEIKSLHLKIHNIALRRQQTIQHIRDKERASRIKERLGEKPHPQDDLRYKIPVNGFAGPNAVGLKEHAEARRTWNKKCPPPQHLQLTEFEVESSYEEENAEENQEEADIDLYEKDTSAFSFDD